MNHAQHNHLFLLLTLCISLFFIPYTLKTPANSYVHDYGGHVEYIKIIAQDYRIPGAMEGWSTHHPPLYYIMAAYVFNWQEAQGISPDLLIENLQWLSLFFYAGFLLYGLLTIHYGLRTLPAWVQFLCALLFLTLPSGVMHAPRIGNDSLYFFTYMAAFYHLLRFADKDTGHGTPQFALYLFWAGLALLSKSNAVILLVLPFAYCVVKSFRTSLFQAAKKPLVLIGAIWLLGAFALSFGDNLLESYQRDQRLVPLANTNAYSGNAEYLRVGNSLENYVIFDIHTFIIQPFANTGDDATGRQYFWNLLLRTMLLTEWQFNHSPILIYSALALGATCLVLLAGIFLLPVAPRGTVHFQAFPHVIHLILSAMAVMAYRISYPDACNNDFRYIFPAIVSLLLLIHVTMYRLYKAFRPIGIIFLGSAIIFVLSSVVFFRRAD